MDTIHLASIKFNLATQPIGLGLGASETVTDRTQCAGEASEPGTKSVREKEKKKEKRKRVREKSK